MTICYPGSPTKPHPQGNVWLPTSGLIVAHSCLIAQWHYMSQVFQV